MLHEGRFYSNSPVTENWYRAQIERVFQKPRVLPIEILGVPIRPRAPAREIIARVAFWHGVTTEDILSRRKPRKLATARFDAIAAVKIAYPNISSPRLGQLFGGRDHTTILHALRMRGLR